MLADVFRAAMSAGAFASGKDTLDFINRNYGKSRKGTKPKKSAAVYKRRKANKAAAKQRKVNRK